MIKLFHNINNSLVVLTPIAVCLSPSSMNLPVDLVLGVALPLHAHIGMNMVITDYGKKGLGAALIGPARWVMLGVTVSTALGLTKLNLTGPGITETIKSLWRRPAS